MWNKKTPRIKENELKFPKESVAESNIKAYYHAHVIQWISSPERIHIKIEHVHLTYKLCYGKIGSQHSNKQNSCESWAIC